MADPFFASSDQRFTADLDKIVQEARGLPSLETIKAGGEKTASPDTDYDAVASRYDVPINVLMAVGESGGDVDRAARSMRAHLNRGMDDAGAIVAGIANGNAEIGTALMDRARKIGADLYPEPRQVEAVPLGAADAPQTEWKPIGISEPAPAGNPDGNAYSDFKLLMRSGFNTAAEDVQELVRRTPFVGQAIADAASAADRWMMGKSTDEIFREVRQSVENGLSPEMLAARKKDWISEGPDGYSFGPAWSDPRTYYSGLVESLPEMVVTMGPTGMLAKGAYTGAIARGAGKAAAARAAARTATIAGGLMEGGLGGAQSSRSVRDRISAMTPEQLASSEAIETLLRQGKSFEEARAALADEASTQAFLLAGVTTGIFGGLGDRALAKIITGPAKGRLSAAVRGAVGEGLLEEAPQSGFQQASENYALQNADPNQRLMEGVANQAVGGAAVGGLMGAGLGAAAPHAGDAPDTRPAETEESLSAAAPDAPAAPAAMPAPAEAEPKGPMERALDHGIAEMDAAVRRTSALTGQRVAVTDEFGSHSGTITDDSAYGLTFLSDDGEIFEYSRNDLDAGTVTLQPEAGTEPAPVSPEAGTEQPQEADIQPPIAAEDDGNWSDRPDDRAGILEADERYAPVDPSEREARIDEMAKGFGGQGREPTPTADDSDDYWRDRIEERAGILEFDEGYPREEAERIAREEVEREQRGEPPVDLPEREASIAKMMKGFGLSRADAEYVATAQEDDRKAGKNPRSIEQIFAVPDEGDGENDPGTNDVFRVEANHAPKQEKAARATAPRRSSPLVGDFVVVTDEDGEMSGKVVDDGANGVTVEFDDGQHIEYSHDDINSGAVKIDSLDVLETVTPREGEVLPPEAKPAEPKKVKPPVIIEGEARRVDAAAHEAATSPGNGLPEPTQAQKEAGNYRLGHLKIGGLNISVENPQGSQRKGVDKDGKPWAITMQSHYGYIRGTIGRDKDHVDAFVKPGTADLPDASHVFVVNQVEPTTGRFDEHKALIGYRDRGEAEAAYRANYAKGWKGLGSIVRLTAPQFKDWLNKGDTTKPLALPAPSEAANGTRVLHDGASGAVISGTSEAGQPAGAAADAGGAGAGRRSAGKPARGGPADLPRERETADAQPALTPSFREGKVGDRLGAATEPWPAASAEDRVAAARGAGWDREHAEYMARQPFDKLRPEAREKLKRIADAAPAVTARPVAAAGLTSYRYKGPNGWIMIGARDDADALREANRSLELPNAKRNELQVWDGEKYAAVEIAPAAGGATTDTAASQRSNVTPGPAGQPVTSKPKGKRKSPRKIVSEREAAISDYFTPGNIVSASTGGFDRVIAFGLTPDGYGNLVTVQAVRKDGNRWVDLRGEGVRRHGTMPSERALKAGPVERADSTATDISAKPTESEPETRYSMAPGPKAPAGAFGPVFPGYTNKPEAAIRKLMDEKRGEVADAFVHPELGPIAFVYGNEKMGLRHIEAKRGLSFVNKIPSILSNGRLERDNQNLPRAFIVQDTDPRQIAIIRLDWDGKEKTWLVTAYPEWKNDGLGKISNTADQSEPVPGKSLSARPVTTQNTTTDSAGQSSKRQPEDTRYSVVPGSEADARRFLEGPPVASMKGDEVPTLGKMANIADWVGDHYAGTVRGKVVHPEIGEIRLDRRSVKDSLSHGYGRDKVQALYLLPEVLPKARILAEESRKDGQNGFVLGAPVEIGERPMVAAMIVTRDKDRTGLYVHEVVLLEKLRNTAFKTGALTANPKGDALIGAEPGAIKSVLEKVFRGNDGQMSLGLSDRTGFSAAADARTHLLAGIYSNAIGKMLDAGRIVIHDDATTLPGKEHPDGAIQGMTTADGTIHLVASNLTRANIEPVLLHEAFHSGARPLIGDAAWNRVMERVSIAAHKAMERATSGTAGPHDAFWTAALTNARVAGTPEAHLAEEVAAYAIEHSEQAPAGVRDMIDRLIGAVKAWLLRRFGIQAGAVTPRELRSLASAALRDWDANTAASPVSQDGARYSMASATPPAADKGSLFDKAKATMSRAITAAMVGAKGSDKDRGRFSTLALVPTRPLFLELAQGMPSAKTYIDLKMSMDTMRNDWHALAADVVQRWTRLASKDKAANKDLMVIMHEATLAQVDPTARFDSFMTPGDWYGLQNNDPDSARYEDLLKKQAEDKERKAAHDDLVERFGKLPEEAQALFREVRDHYRRMADATQKQVLDNVEEALKAIDKKAERTYDDELKRIADEGLTGKERDAAIEDAERRRTFTKSRTKRNKAARLRKLRNDLRSKRLQGAYFPLARFGHYFVTLRDADGKVVSFSRFESLKKRDAFIADIERTKPDLKIERGVLDAKPGDTGAVDAKFMADLDAILDGAGAPEALRDAFWQRYLETLPDMSIRKNRIHRKGTAGFDTDAIRAFAHNVFHGSHQLARLTYAIRMQTAVDEMAKQAQEAPDPDRAMAVSNEIRWRHNFIMNPSQAPLSHLLTSLSFIWTMGANLSSAFVNIDQTFTKGIPWIAADRELRPGVARTTAEIMRAMRDFTMGGGWAEKSSKLTADEKAAMRAGYENGLIDRTQAHDVAGVAETGVAYSARRDSFMKFLSWPMHQTERFNREVTFLASYRMAREKGMEHGAAIRKASDLTWMVHFDNQSTSKPRFMQGDIGRVAFAMKSFQANILYRIFRDLHQAVKGESPEVQKEAIGRLAGTFVATALAAGVKGSIGYSTVMMIMAIAQAFAGGDDDDPEQALRKWVLEHTGDTMIGRAVGGMMMDGIPGYLTGTALSGRIGMSDLWFRSSDRDLEGSDAFVNLAGQVLGVPFGLASGIYGGTEELLKGNVWRGTEAMSPAAVRNIMKAVRYGWEGALNRKGAAIVENVPVADIIKQAIGFTPAQIAEQNARTTAAYNMQQRVRDEKAGLVDALWRFRDNPERRAEAIDRVKAFNKKHPTAPITPDSINQSMRGRERYLKNAIGGANIDKRLRPEIEQKLPPSIY